MERTSEVGSGCTAAEGTPICLGVAGMPPGSGHGQFRQLTATLVTGPRPHSPKA
jgi:hypothetical protein